MSVPACSMWFGLLAGIGIENKLSMIFFCAAISIGVLLTPARKLLRSPWALLAVLIAAICFLPTLMWQYHRDWPTLQMLANVRRMHKNEEVSALRFMVRQMLMLVAASALVWIAGTVLPAA